MHRALGRERLGERAGHDDCAREVLGLPADTVVAMAITFGYPVGGKASGRGDRRIDLETFVRRGRWDGPAGL